MDFLTTAVASPELGFPAWLRITHFLNFVFVGVLIILNQPITQAFAVGVLMLGLYIPMGYYTDTYLFKRRERKDRVRPDPARIERGASGQSGHSYNRGAPRHEVLRGSPSA